MVILVVLNILREKEAANIAKVPRSMLVIITIVAPNQQMSSDREVETQVVPTVA